MTPLPGGYSDTTESQRQVLVVDEDPRRRQRLCALFTRHGLKVQAAPLHELGTAAQGRSGVILLGRPRTGGSGWDAVEQLRAAHTRVPVILLAEPRPDGSHTGPPIHACLPPDASDAQLVSAVERSLGTPPRAAPARRLGTILVVDDDPKLCQILQEFLELKGFRVTTANSGQAALDSLKRLVPDVVLLDVKMPGLNGILTMKSLRMAHPNLPVVFISQLDEEQTKDDAATLGANDYLVKPFNFEHLETILLTKIFV